MQSVMDHETKVHRAWQGLLRGGLEWSPETPTITGYALPNVDCTALVQPDDKPPPICEDCTVTFKRAKWLDENGALYELVIGDGVEVERRLVGVLTSYQVYLLEQKGLIVRKNEIHLEGEVR